ncbi:hypothetical protein T261_6261 [Streptomyces lydicus]|nr:hypothetical protein T261_6261 [Streptomyces lydicus]
MAGTVYYGPRPGGGMRLGKPLAVGIAEEEAPEAGEPLAEEWGAGAWAAVQPLGEVAVAAVAGSGEPGRPFAGSLAAR